MSCERLSIFAVDDVDVRNRFYNDFTAAHDDRLPNQRKLDRLIPPETWLVGDNFLGETVWFMWVAKQLDGLYREQYYAERARINAKLQRGKRYPFDHFVVEAHKNKNGIMVAITDGDEIRRKWDCEYGLGGNSIVYPDQTIDGKPTASVERRVPECDRPAVLNHEIHESTKMMPPYYLDYQQAHDHATWKERRFRKKTSGMDYIGHIHDWEELCQIFDIRKI